MDDGTICALAALNNRFYRENHQTFSQSRQASWPGWERVCEHLLVEGCTRRVLDLASGNMRFERFMRDTFPDADLTFTCVDACADLAQDIEGAQFVERDIISDLLNGHAFIDERKGGYDAAVSFGFMHHIPGAALRESFALSLATAVRPGGVIALSFWQFMDEPKIAKQAEHVTEEFQGAYAYALEHGDYILGWNGREGAYRYCHHFSSGEVDALALRLADACEVLDRFNSDGRNKALNSYLVLRRRP